MLDLGLDVLLKGNNMIRLLQGLWVALWISLVIGYYQYAAWYPSWYCDDMEK